MKKISLKREKNGRVFVLLIAAMVYATTARAQDNYEASQQAYATGEQLFAEGRYDEAVAAFQQSYALVPFPDTTYNIAACYEALGRIDEARLRYEAIASTPDTSDELRAQAQEALDRLAEPDNTGPPVLAAVDPLPLPPDEGIDQMWFWIATGTTAALGIAAGATGGAMLDAESDFHDGGSVDADLAAKGEDLQLAANVLIGIAAAAAAATAVLAIFTDWSGDENSAVAVTPSGVAVRW